MVSRTSMFRSIVESAQSALKQPIKDIPKTHGSNYDTFKALNNVQKREILSAVQSLKNYETNSKVTNQRRRDLFKLMTSKQQKICKDVGYLDKLSKIDNAITANQKFTNDVANYTISKYGLSESDFEILDNDKKNRSTTSASNYRVIEALGHYTRDWQSNTIVGPELLPVFEYIAAQLSALIPYEAKKDTCLVFPGSGLGRLAHIFSDYGYGAIHSIEFSGLMNAFVDFNYSKPTQSYTFYPYIHTCSDFYNTESQLRTFEFEPLGSKPDSLYLHQSDFRDFKIPDRDKKYENVVVVTAFFIDTAENLIEYLDVIEKLTKPSGSVQRGYWINVGPLKYGSAAQVELNADELKDVRAKLGWKDYSSVYSIYDKLSLGNDTGLVGYLTDKESMWQGYYGLNMFASGRKENKF
ncbi:hypothetical protein G210_5620 [Candida maltosa Xu316]|uniref:Uncharacterized protein n=1 Tax=Candida maltosa (strain Xu316) TaxID=1245528 RepID=M3K2T2_CANMX|nr:hypothetical protein G210_5620 [Candida maltosa Xu316]